MDQKEIKFDLKSLLGAGITLAILGIALTYAVDITDDVRDDLGEDLCAARTDTYTSYNDSAKLCYNSSNTHIAVGNAEFNATTDTINGLIEIPEKIPTLAVIIVAAAILGILVRFLWQRFS